ncbi:hypothetical protein DY000_02035110 [Brassica cretica]|uniref:Uncharacterized protein n=1 Tax=Brassica cretica TaxID=69181 RepID=A0ABQ7DKS7_BRACR|nr:hypothetical protein DY000_02035110 [Brassica cretica]
MLEIAASQPYITVHPPGPLQLFRPRRSNAIPRPRNLRPANAHHHPISPIFSFLAPDRLTALHLFPLELHHPPQLRQFQTRIFLSILSNLERTRVPQSLYSSWSLGLFLPVLSLL